jgi:hypothetical protein
MFSMGAVWAQPNQTYFYEHDGTLSFDGAIFHPELISGDGRVLYGETGSGWTEWTKADGLRQVVTWPPHPELDPKAVNYDGTSISGIFVNGRDGIKIDDYGLFRWTASGGVELLKPHFLVGGLTNGLDGTTFRVSDDGKEFWFYCDQANGRSAECPFSPVASPNPEIPKLWRQGQGFEPLEAKFAGYDAIVPSRDGTHFFAVRHGNHRPGWLDQPGHFTQLQGIPADFNFDGSIVMNAAGTFVAMHVQPGADGMPVGRTAVWDRQGRLLPPMKQLAGCPRSSYNVIDIDDSGVIFAKAFCLSISGNSTFTGLRITAQRAQTIGEWLRSEGIPNDLGPGALPELISDNGKTIYGITSNEPVSEDGPRSGDVRRSDGINCTRTPCVFLAHVP